MARKTVTINRHRKYRSETWQEKAMRIVGPHQLDRRTFREPDSTIDTWKLKQLC